MKNNNAKGWLSCLVALVIMFLVAKFLFRFFWVLILVMPVLNIIRGLIWKRRIRKTQQQMNDFVNENVDQQQNYCEAEFEILDDEKSEE